MLGRCRHASAGARHVRLGEGAEESETGMAGVVVGGCEVATIKLEYRDRAVVT